MADASPEEWQAEEGLVRSEPMRCIFLNALDAYFSVFCFIVLFCLLIFIDCEILLGFLNTSLIVPMAKTYQENWKDYTSAGLLRNLVVSWPKTLPNLCFSMEV